MERAKRISLFITLILWGTLVGGMMYSHVVFFPAYLSRLPESTQLIKGPYGLHDENFWMSMHPVMILSFIVTIILNWKLTDRRKFILTAFGIYVLAIIATFSFFVPELIAFAESSNSATTSSDWFQRGQTWQHMSWIRGFFMYVAFIMLLIALTENKLADR